MRGKGADLASVTAATRITPACAGKSRAISAFPSAIQDHPRVCGEKFVEVAKIFHDLGSPPRVRGKVLHLCFRVALKGITPACAGKSGWHSCCPGCNRDHPRVCGEKVLLIIGISKARGSPPRVRGKVSERLMGGNYARITPACAGKRFLPPHP